MNKKIITILLSSLFLSGCLSIMLDLNSKKNYHTELAGQCLALAQDVQLWKSRKTHSYSKNFITAIPSIHIPSHFKQHSTLTKGTKLKVTRIYDTYIHGTAGDWHLRIKLKVLNGPYKDIEVEIPGIYTTHPHPLFFKHETQRVVSASRESLNPNNIEFNTNYLVRCIN